MESLQFPDPRDPNRIECLADEIRELSQTTDKAIVLNKSIGGIFEHSFWLRGIEPLFADMAFNKKYVEDLAERIVDWKLEFWDFVLEEVGPYVHVVVLGDDLGGRDGPLFSPDLYREIYKPRHRRLTDLIHRKTQAKTFLHSCGSIYWALPDIIDSGIDIINPVQISAKDLSRNNFAFWRPARNQSERVEE